MSDKNKAGILGLVFSFLFPIVGVIIYFLQKDKVQDAQNYLMAALGGFVLSIVLNFLF